MAPGWRARCALLLALAVGPALATRPLEACLAPGDDRRGLHIAFEVGASFCLRGLAPSSAYEVRVSWPASQPSELTLALHAGPPPRGYLPGRVSGLPQETAEAGAGGGGDDDDDDVAAGELVVTGSERVAFRTDGEGRVLLPARGGGGSGAPGWVGVPANRTHLRVGVRSPTVRHPSAPPRGGTTVDVRLDPLLLGGLLPARAAPAVVAVAVSLVATVAVSAVLLRWLSPPPPLASAARLGGGHGAAAASTSPSGPSAAGQATQQGDGLPARGVRRRRRT